MRPVNLLVVSAPGTGSERHWSLVEAAEFVAAARAEGASVEWLCALPDGVSQPDAATCFRHAADAPHGRVAKNSADVPLERALTARLREVPTTVVVNFGLGARGTPNVPWLADRLGSPAFAVVRAAEVACARGDLVDRDGAPCSQWDDPERCAWCVRVRGWLRRRPRVAELQSRVDLCVASLQVCRAVFVRDADRVPMLDALGIPLRRVHPLADGMAVCGPLLAAIADAGHETARQR